jgi:radical SAM superfamily enzyme YgiQ (UPF0313 family)
MEDQLKISLIYPGISVKERYGRDIGEIGGKQAPLGLLYLSSYLKQNGFETQVIDAEGLSLSDDAVIEMLFDFSPDAIAISMTTVAFANAVRLAHSIHGVLPEAAIIAGGPHVTANPRQTIEFGEFDFGVLKEGEETLFELLNAMFAGFCNSYEKRESDLKNKTMQGPARRGHKNVSAKFADIKGIVFRDKDGKLIITEEREYIQDIDNLPYPDRDALSDISLYRPPVGCYLEKFSVSMITSRGCPYRCIFCDNNTFGRNIRWFSPEYVVREIEHVIKKYAAKEISFVDDTFPANRKRFVAILELIKERQVKFVWTCMANVNDLDDEILKLMKEAGCWQIAVGIESGDNEILKLIRKGITVEKVRDVVTVADKLGIMVKGFFMLGHPGETKETLQKTMDFSLELPLTDVTCTLNTPIMGTELYEMAALGKYGKFDRDVDNALLNYWEPVFVPTGLTEDELYAAQRDFFKKFYLRAGILRKQLKKINNLTVLFRLLATVLKLLFITNRSVSSRRFTDWSKS